MDLSPRGHEQARRWRVICSRSFDAITAADEASGSTLDAAFELERDGADDFPGLREFILAIGPCLGWEQVPRSSRESLFQWLDQLEQGFIPNPDAGNVSHARGAGCVNIFCATIRGKRWRCVSRWDDPDDFVHSAGVSVVEDGGI